MPKSDIIAKTLHCSLIATVLILAHIEVYWIFCTISSPNKTIQRCGTIRNLIVVYASSIKVYLVGPRGLMDNASDFGSEDSRFESWRGRRSVLNCSWFCFLSWLRPTANVRNVFISLFLTLVQPTLSIRLIMPIYGVSFNQQ